MHSITAMKEIHKLIALIKSNDINISMRNWTGINHGTYLYGHYLKEKCAEKIIPILEINAEVYMNNEIYYLSYINSMLYGTNKISDYLMLIDNSEFERLGFDISDSLECNIEFNFFFLMRMFNLFRPELTVYEKDRLIEVQCKIVENLELVSLDKLSDDLQELTSKKIEDNRRHRNIEHANCRCYSEHIF